MHSLASSLSLSRRGTLSINYWVGRRGPINPPITASPCDVAAERRARDYFQQRSLKGIKAERVNADQQKGSGGVFFLFRLCRFFMWLGGVFCLRLIFHLAHWVMSREFFLSPSAFAHLFETFRQRRLVSVIFYAQQTVKLTPNKTMVNATFFTPQQNNFPVCQLLWEILFFRGSEFLWGGVQSLLMRSQI